MKLKSSNAALAILLGGASIVTPAAAQDAAKPTPGAALQYVGADTRLGIGYDSQTKLRGELFQVLRSDDKSATLAEIWASRDSGGAKLSQHWSSNGSAVNKVFGAVDQGTSNLRKASLGGGQEYEQWFWNTYLSKGLSGSRLTGTTAIANTISQSGLEAGRPYVEDVTTTVTTRSFQRAYDWGVGARAGHFYESALMRVTAGVDYEWGKFSSRQWTGTLMAEKFFAGSPISVAITGEINRRSGDFEGARNDQRGFVMLRYELGGPRTSFRPNRVTRSVTTTERVPDPNWRPVAAVSAAAAAPVSAPVATVATTAQPVEPTTRIEKRVARATSSDAQETYFDLGSAKLKPAAFKELDALVVRINGQTPYVELKVNVVGHTCPTGADRDNLVLSNKRAEAVKAYLVSKGVPTETVTTSGKAGRSPKYPEVKGQSFRNRRADTEVSIVKEKSEDVRVTVPGATSTAAVTPVAPVAPPAVAVAVTPAAAPMIERQVTRDIVEDVPNSWTSRALRNPAQHKTTVDSYRWLEASTAQATGPRRFINRGPAAVNDAYTIDCTAPVTFNVLANDSDPDGDALTITSVSTPSKGTVAISGGRIVYTPSATSCGGGTDNFTYSISDGKGGTATAAVSVTINNTTPINTPPVAVNDAYTVTCSTPRTFNVLLNDSDKDGDKLTITSVSMPGKGTAVISNGNIVYTAAANTCGGATDNFTYSISDGNGGTATATVAVTISNTTPPANTAPVAVNDAYTINCGAASTFDVLLNDSDKDGDKLTITSVSTPGKGTAVISGGKIVYTPAANACGGATDSFTYSISDGNGGTATATVAVTINNTMPVNTPPVAVNDAYTVDCSVANTFNVLLNDSDKDGDKLTITSVSTPGNGTAVISNGNIVYTAAANTCGGATDSFTYSIADGKGGTATATVAVTIRNTVPVLPANNPPVAVNDLYIVPCRRNAVLDVLTNDSDRDGDPLIITSIRALTQPSVATLSISADKKTLTYTPGASCFVTETFSYTISDGRGGTATATVTLIDP